MLNKLSFLWAHCYSYMLAVVYFEKKTFDCLVDCVLEPCSYCDILYQTIACINIYIAI